MKFLKGFALTLLGLILSLSLVIFGIAFMVNSTVLNPRFIRTQILELNLSDLVQQAVREAGTQPDNAGGIPPEELMTAMADAVTKLQPLLKERVAAATDSLYDYLLGRRPEPELAQTLRATILNKDFFIEVIDRVDISPFLKEFLIAQLPAEDIPPEFQGYVDQVIDPVVAELKPWFKKQIEAGADPVLDYFVGETDTFTLVLPTDELRPLLIARLRDAVTRSPPPQLAGIPQALWRGQLDEFLRGFSAQIPPTIEVDQDMFGPDARTDFVQALRDGEEALIQARKFVSIFQTAYRLLIVLMLLCIVSIVLVHRQVKGATRNLGIIFLSYGVLEYAGVLIGRYFVTSRVALMEVPLSLQQWMVNLINRLFDPLGIFSMALLIAGVVLIAVSFAYPRLRARG